MRFFPFRNHLAPAVLSLLLLSGCVNQIDYSRRPADWPDLAIVEQTVPEAEIHTTCGIPKSGLPILFGCAIADFKALVCRVFYLLGMEGEAWLVEHERAHCRGHDHKGSNGLELQWEFYKATTQPSP